MLHTRQMPDGHIPIITQTHKILHASPKAKHTSTKPNKQQQQQQKQTEMNMAALCLVKDSSTLFSSHLFNLHRKDLQNNSVYTCQVTGYQMYPLKRKKTHPSQQADTIQQRKSMKHNLQSNKHVNKLSSIK